MVFNRHTEMLRLPFVDGPGKKRVFMRRTS